MVSQELLDAITVAAARCLPIGQIAAGVGMTDEEWQAALRGSQQAVRMAVLTGRVQVQLKTAASLAECSDMGKAAASLFILQSNYGWPSKSRGRPRRGGVRSDAQPSKFRADSL